MLSINRPHGMEPLAVDRLDQLHSKPCQLCIALGWQHVVHHHPDQTIQGVGPACHDPYVPQCIYLLHKARQASWIFLGSSQGFHYVLLDSILSSVCLLLLGLEVVGCYYFL